MVLVLEKISFGYICLEEFRVCIYRIELDGNITTQLPTISAMHELNLCLITEDSLKLCSRCHITHLAIHCTAMITVADNPIATCLAARSCRTRPLLASPSVGTTSRLECTTPQSAASCKPTRWRKAAIG